MSYLTDIGDFLERLPLIGGEEAGFNEIEGIGPEVKSLISERKEEFHIGKLLLQDAERALPAEQSIAVEEKPPISNEIINRITGISAEDAKAIEAEATQDVETEVEDDADVRAAAARQQIAEQADGSQTEVVRA